MSDISPRRLAARWIGFSPIRIWGLTPPQRLRRSLQRAGLWDCAAWNGAVPPAGSVVLFNGDAIYDDELVAALVRTPGALLMADGKAVAAHAPADLAEAAANALQGGPLPDLDRLGPADLALPYSTTLRKRTEPIVMLVSEANRTEAEDRLFGASYKGVTDFVTKYVWPVPARQVTRLCAAAHIPPNAVTLAGLALTIAAFVLFHNGWLWSGLAAAWAMTFLDTVDGKLARVTLTSSRLGDVLDHGLDLIHPPFWWWAWWSGSGGAHMDALAVVVAGYVLLRLQEGLFIRRFGIELHIWRRFDSRFRLVTARRNPILAILTLGLLAGAPAAAFVVVAAWTLVSLAVHAIRILMALRLYRGGERITSWLEG